MSFADVKAAAKGNWHSILCDLGVPAEALTNKHKACVACGGEDRFRYDDRHGNGDFYCNGCGAGDGFSLLSRFLGVDLGGVVKMVGELLQVQGDPVQKVNRRAEFRELFRGCGEGRGVVEYLRGRGLTDCPPCLRYHPSVEGKPAMLAVIAGPDGEAVGVHRTHLVESDVRKRTTSMKGTLPHGSAVRLYSEEKVLGIAEGIETAIAAHEMFGVPVWAVLSTSGMKNFTVPKGVETLIIYGDTDKNYAGHAAAYALAHKLACDDRVSSTAAVQMPIEGDWLDELMFVKKASGCAA